MYKAHLTLEWKWCCCFSTCD